MHSCGSYIGNIEKHVARKLTLYVQGPLLGVGCRLRSWDINDTCANGGNRWIRWLHDGDTIRDRAGGYTKNVTYNRIPADGDVIRWVLFQAVRDGSHRLGYERQIKDSVARTKRGFAILGECISQPNVWTKIIPIRVESTGWNSISRKDHHQGRRVKIGQTVSLFRCRCIEIPADS